MNALAIRNNPAALFNPFFNDFLDDFFDDTVARAKTRYLRREDDKLVFEADAPGVKKEDMKVFLQEGRLSVQFKRGNQTYSRTEYVGDVVEPTAKLEDGVLTVKMRIPNAQKIEVPIE